MEKGNKEQIKKLLRGAIIYSINTKNEFFYLKGLAEKNGKVFNDRLVDICLDRYIQLRKEGKDKFKSKYASMWITAWRIMYEYE